MSLRVAVLHGKPLRDESASNATRIASVLRLAESAAAAGSGLLVLPELFLSDGKSKAAQPVDGPLLDGIATLCSTVGIAVCVTYCEADDDGRRYSGAAVFDRSGKMVLHRRKVRLGPGLEGRLYAPGAVESCASPAELRGALVDEPHSAVRLGVVIGSELEHPATAQLLALRGAQVLLVASSGELPEPTVSTRARDNHVGVAVSSPGSTGIFDAAGSEIQTQSVPVQGGELRVGVLEVGDHGARRLQCDLDLDRVLANELLGIADDAALTEARDAASKEADELSTSLRRTLQALQEDDLDDDQGWSGSDTMAAFGCVMCNLFVGTALAAIAAILLMAEPLDSPCRRAGEGGVAGISACAANLVSTAAAAGRGEQFPQHVCTTAAPWAQAALRSVDLCPTTAPVAFTEPVRSTPALLSMDVQHGGIVLAGRRFFGSSSTLSIWSGENPSDVAEVRVGSDFVCPWGTSWPDHHSQCLAC
jgi:predicted amidohydrolase